MTKLPLSLVVLTRNEAANVARCLESVPFADDKLVLDSGSTDATIEIARAHGARVAYQPWLGFGPQREAGSRLAKHDWVLALDADEVLSEELQAELRGRFAELAASDVACVWLRRSAWYMGRPMRWYRPMVGEKLGRLYHRGRAHWSTARVHERLSFTGPSLTFRHVFHHHHSPTLVHKQLKVLTYSELKALDWLDHRRPVRMWLAPGVFLLAFFKDYVLRLAFLDGWRGLIVSHVAANYAVYKRFRHYELSTNPPSRASGQQALAAHGLDRERVQPIPAADATGAQAPRAEAARAEAR